jgi:hypothetical protein
MGGVAGHRRDGHRVHVLVDVQGRGTILCWSTRVGDGLFGFATRLAGTKSPALGLAVDSGQLAFVAKRIIDGLQDLPKELTEVCAEITLLKPVNVTVDEHGNVAAPDPLPTSAARSVLITEYKVGIGLSLDGPAQLG